MKTLLVFAALLTACARSPSSPSDPVQDHDQIETDATAPRVREYCPVGERPLFFVGSPEECATIRFDCPPDTRYVEDERCGCGCDY